MYGAEAYTVLPDSSNLRAKQHALSSARNSTLHARKGGLEPFILRKSYRLCTWCLFWAIGQCHYCESLPSVEL